MRIINYLVISTFFLVLFIFNSCGALLEDLRVIGKWEFSQAEFYAKENSVDALRIYSGINKKEPDKNHPIKYAFFGNDAEKDDYTLEINQDKTIRLIKGDIDATVPDVKIDFMDGEWSVDSYENSLTIKVNENTTSYGFWRDGFKLKNYWPLKDYSTLEITIKATDAGENYFKIRLEDKTILAESIKATFTKL
jgi:hypothetical protein